jgi:hypothetical protein
MDVRASDPALEHVRAHGGEVWIWLDVQRCCSGAVSRLRASCQAPSGCRGRETRRFEPMLVGDVMLHLWLGAGRPPDEQRIDVRGRFRPRLAAHRIGTISLDDRGSVAHT